MANYSYDITDLKKYVNKLTFYIARESVFSFGNTKILDKSRVDDLICCIESSMPEAYKTFIKSSRSNKPKSYICYNQLITSVKKKFFLSSELYIVKNSEIVTMAKAFITNIESDLRVIQNS